MPPEDEKDEAEHQKKLDAKVVTCGAGHNACFKTYTSNYQVLQGKKELGKCIHTTEMDISLASHFWVL